MSPVQPKIAINFEGAFFVHHSLGMVNRELAFELIVNTDFDIRLLRKEPDQFTPSPGSKFSRLVSLQPNPHQNPDIHIRHHWPPNFNKVSSGKLIVIFPWEYGSLPIHWRDQICSNVDEIWVPTTFLKKCYIESGIPPEKIAVIPNGIDPLLFNSKKDSSKAIDEIKNDTFCFLFNGGATSRKGVDILVNAYLSEFKREEKVSLIIKDSFSYGKELASKIQALCKRNDTATMHYLLKNFDHEELPSLYRSCDCYVHPYRAEGYGLPIAESLACGKPVIVTGNGACRDFVFPEYGYLVDSTQEYMNEKSISGMKTVNFPFWFIPDMFHLQKLMRHVFNNRDEASAKGIAGEQTMKNNHTWSHASRHAILRINSNSQL